MEQSQVFAFKLGNYPNPFAATTRIQYTVPVDAKVFIKVFDGMGREVVFIFNGESAAGTYSKEYNAAKLSSGVYYVRMIATVKGRQFMETQKLIKAD